MENTPPQCYNETKKPSAYRLSLNPLPPLALTDFEKMSDSTEVGTLFIYLFIYSRIQAHMLSQLHVELSVFVPEAKQEIAIFTFGPA